MISTDQFVRAANHGHTEIIDQYIREGGDVDVDKYGWTALGWASSYGHLEVVEHLIRSGADVNVQDSRDWTSLMYASYEGHLEVMKILEDPNRYILLKKLDTDNESDAIQNSDIL